MWRQESGKGRELAIRRGGGEAREMMGEGGQKTREGQRDKHLDLDGGQGEVTVCVASLRSWRT